MPIYDPTIYKDYITPVNAKNLNKSEQATYMLGQDMQRMSNTIINFSEDINIIKNDYRNLEKITLINTKDIKNLGNSNILLLDAIKNKSDIGHKHKEYALVGETSNTSSYLLRKEITRYIKML